MSNDTTEQEVMDAISANLTPLQNDMMRCFAEGAETGEQVAKQLGVPYIQVHFE